LKLNGFDNDYNYTPTYPSKQIGSKPKPTLRIKRLKSKQYDNPAKYLKGASVIQDKLKLEKEKAENALKLNSLFS
jgi:hypothetical protein